MQQRPSKTIKYRAIYHDPNQSPFRAKLTVPTKTVVIDATVPLKEVERMAREGADSGHEFIRLEVVGS